jgi:glycosyltransferase involved in cell wall biosynthesis
MPRRARVTVLYHYFHPDDVVSARHLSDFCEDLAARGWSVEAVPCNRGCRDDRQTYPLRERWRGVDIRRVWRPRFRQSSGIGRIVNALWMIIAWAAIGLRRPGRRPDVLVVGTDPVLSVLAAKVVKALCGRVRVAHWAYDLYPEAPVADHILRADSFFVRFLRRLLRRAYTACDLIADLGPCMRARLSDYGHRARTVTLVSWALSEPAAIDRPDPVVRAKLFGDARLAILYSGNFGRAHSYADVLALSRRLRNSGVHFCFAVRGNRADELREAVRPDDANVSFAEFTPEAELRSHLAAADVHVASLRPEWTGVVVPSKFFGSLAAGRPVLFAGTPDSAIALWIRQYGLGWVLGANSVDSTAEELLRLADSPADLLRLQQRCQSVYREHFARRSVMDAWDRELRALLRQRPAESTFV